MVEAVNYKTQIMDEKYRIFIYSFQLVCWITTGLLLCYWIYLFALDEDICMVDYKKYYDKPDHEFPVLSFCLRNPFSEEKLRLEDPDIDPQSYGLYLLGKNYSSNMLKVKYKNVLLDASKHVARYWVKWRNGTFKYTEISNNNKLLIPSFSGSWDDKFYNCYSLQIPHNAEIVAFSVQISNYIFSGGIRSNDLSFITMLHGRNQLLISKTLKYMYPRREPNDSYVLRYKLKGVERIKRRNKRKHPCFQDWKNYDAMIYKDHAKHLGCTPPYFDSIPDIPPCSDKYQMTAFPFTKRSDDYKKPEPCEGLETIDYEFEEHLTENFIDEASIYINGYFWFGLYIYDQKFKEIVQIKDIELILRYSILQIPEYLVVFILKVKSYYSYKPNIQSHQRSVLGWEKENDTYMNQTRSGPNLEKEVTRLEREMKEQLNRIRADYNSIL